MTEHSPDYQRGYQAGYHAGSMTLSADERSAIERQHHWTGYGDTHPPGRCPRDGQPWPCDTEKMRAALVAAEADVAKLGDGLVQWMEAAKAEEARAKALAEALRDIVAWYGDDGPNDSQRVLHDRLEAARAALAAYREATP